MTENLNTEAHLQRAYQVDLASFCRTYGGLREAGRLGEWQKRWVDAAAEATETLNLTPGQLKAVLRVPEAVTVNQPTTIAVLPEATEVFYRMDLLASVARELTAALPAGRQSNWVATRHLDGPYKDQSPIEAVTRGPAHELYRLRSSLNFYGGL